MKERYENPDMWIIWLHSENVIVTSTLQKDADDSDYVLNGSDFGF